MFLGFTGQGSQKAHMGKDFYDNFSQAREVMEIAEDSLQQKISSVMFENDATELNKTINTQPAIMINALMIYNALISNFPSLKKKISCIAGHSVGEYNALCIGNVFDISTGVMLLRKRAIFMENACPTSAGGMAALIGVTKQNVSELLNNEELRGLICEIANDNGAEQIVVSGEVSAINIVCDLAKKHGFRAVKLKVSGAFHSSMMKQAGEQMKIELNKHKFHPISGIKKILSNVTAEHFPNEENKIKELLVKQITSPVRWRETVLNIYQQYEIRNFLEIGSSPVITNLLKKTLPQNDTAREIKTFCISSVKEMEIFLEHYTNNSISVFLEEDFLV